VTEDQWLSDTVDPAAMLEYLYESGETDRRWRLFAIACCRTIWDCLTDHRSRRSVEVAERVLDGQADEVERASAADESRAAWCASKSPDGPRLLGPVFAAEAVALLTDWTRPAVEVGAGVACLTGNEQEDGWQAALLRCIFGNPFNPPTIDPAWLTPAVLDLARLIYDEKKFELMPALGAALSDAGCGDATVLGHCVAESPHVRGCHVVDLLLSKE
jgi:hypothetical protein